MNPSVDNDKTIRWNFDSISVFGLICLIPLVLFILLIFNIFSEFPEFENLAIKKGILVKVGKGDYGKNTWITLIIDGKRENIDIPRNRQVLKLSEEIGEIIELRYEPRLWGKVNVWSISSGNNVYFDYNKKLFRLNRDKHIYRNILLIILTYTLLVYLKNYEIIRNYISDLNETNCNNNFITF